MTVCAVTVTYGDRFHLLRQVIEGLLAEGVDRIVVVNNGAAPGSSSALAQLATDLAPRLVLVPLVENLGSAGGFKAGLAAAQEQTGSTFVWLLDDDNVPEPGSLAALQAVWAGLPPDGRERRVCLVSNRDSRPEYLAMAARDSDDIGLVIHGRNAFMEFDIAHPIRFLQGRFGAESPAPPFPERGYGRLPVAPYGGMYLHRALLERIGLPDERLFLYCDDYEYSHRIVARGGEILLVPASRVRDIDVSASRGLETDAANLFRLYYGTRNMIYLQKLVATNRFLYTLNRLIYWPLFRLNKGLRVLFGGRDRTRNRVIVTAVRDGFRERLGMTYRSEGDC